MNRQVRLWMSPIHWRGLRIYSASQYKMSYNNIDCVGGQYSILVIGPHHHTPPQIDTRTTTNSFQLLIIYQEASGIFLCSPVVPNVYIIINQHSQCCGRLGREFWKGIYLLFRWIHWNAHEKLWFFSSPKFQFLITAYDESHRVFCIHDSLCREKNIQGFVQL